MSNDTTLDMCLSGLYRSMQATALERALEIIAEVGDAKSKAIASEALSIVDDIEASSTATKTEAVKSESKPKKVKSKSKKVRAKAPVNKASTRKSLKKTAKSSSKPTVHIVAIEEAPAASLNGGADTNRLLNWRKQESLSQKKAASRAEVSVGSWQAWESGKWDPSDEMMRRLEKLGV